MIEHKKNDKNYITMDSDSFKMLTGFLFGGGLLTGIFGTMFITNKDKKFTYKDENREIDIK